MSKVCKMGHTYPADKSRCPECRSASNKAWAQYNRDKRRATDRARYAANPEKRGATVKTWREANPGRNAAMSKAWREANQERVIADGRDRYAANPEPVIVASRAWYAANKARRMAAVNAYRKANPSKVAAFQRLRQVTKINAAAAWRNPFFIEEAYALARLRTKMFGFQWDVDHIVPLRSEYVCGLHCEDNLQVIPHSLNLAKGNSFTGVSEVCE